jgi:hypothetical protein
MIYSIHSQNGYEQKGSAQRIRRWKTYIVSMNIETIKEIIKGRKGANLSAVIGKTLKTKKPHAANKVEKVTKLVIRGGVEYDNMGVVKEGRQDGTLPEQNAGLPWGEWAEYPLHITHKDTDYARFYPASGIKFTPQVQYFLNGVEVEKSVVEPLCLASEFPAPKDEEPLCFTIKAENVRDIIL